MGDLTAPIKVASDLAGKFLGPAAEECGLYLQDRLRVWRRGNVQKVLELAHEKLGSQEAKPVEPKILFKVLEEASLEDDGYMREKWASLLASAATGRKVLPSFVSILSQLSPDEARLLEHIYRRQVKLISGHSNVLTENLERLGLILPDGANARFSVSEPGQPRRRIPWPTTILGVAFLDCCGVDLDKG
ncbi:MAG: Abi-alpha family protein [Acidobacteriota bacterium]